MTPDKGVGPGHRHVAAASTNGGFSIYIYILPCWFLPGFLGKFLLCMLLAILHNARWMTRCCWFWTGIIILTSIEHNSPQKNDACARVVICIYLPELCTRCTGLPFSIPFGQDVGHAWHCMATLWRYSEDERAAFENGYRAAIQDVLVMESASARRGKCLRQEVTPTWCLRCWLMMVDW